MSPGASHPFKNCLDLPSATVIHCSQREEEIQRRPESQGVVPQLYRMTAIVCLLLPWASNCRVPPNPCHQLSMLPSSSAISWFGCESSRRIDWVRVAGHLLAACRIKNQARDWLENGHPHQHSSLKIPPFFSSMEHWCLRISVI